MSWNFGSINGWPIAGWVSINVDGVHCHGILVAKQGWPIADSVSTNFSNKVKKV